jgi:hypothetical protein
LRERQAGTPAVAVAGLDKWPLFLCYNKLNSIISYSILLTQYWKQLGEMLILHGFLDGNFHSQKYYTTLILHEKNIAFSITGSTNVFMAVLLG